MKIKWIWNFFLAFLALSAFLVACQPQAPATTPALQSPTQPTTTLTEEALAAPTQFPLGDFNPCENEPHMNGANKCLAINPLDGSYMNPYQTVGCEVNGQKVGIASRYALDKDLVYLPCAAPLYDQAVVLEDVMNERLAGALTRFGPGSLNSTLGGVYFEKDGWGIMNLDVVKVLGCYLDMTGYTESKLPQYEMFGASSEVPYLVTDRVLVEFTDAGGNTYTAWGWSGSFDATSDGRSHFDDGYTPVCPERK